MQCNLLPRDLARITVSWLDGRCRRIEYHPMEPRQCPLSINHMLAILCRLYDARNSEVLCNECSFMCHIISFICDDFVIWEEYFASKKKLGIGTHYVKNDF